jgi:hypothetical protein
MSFPRVINRYERQNPGLLYKPDTAGAEGIRHSPRTIEASRETRTENAKEAP